MSNEEFCELAMSDAILLLALKHDCEREVLEISKMIAQFYRSDDIDFLVVVREILREVREEIS